MRIALCGAGFAGLALAYYLTQHTNVSVTLIDRAEIGESTSGLAAGLLHPYRSSSFLPNWNAEIALQETLHLLRLASNELGSACYRESGILRPLTEDKSWDIHDLEMGAEFDWYPAEKTGSIPHLIAQDALFMKHGVTVDCPQYLQGLFALSKKRGLTFIKQHISRLQELEAFGPFDAIAVTVGAYTNTIEETKKVPITPIKGQLLELAMSPRDMLPFPLFGKAYLITKASSCILGATFERRFTTPEPDLETARADLIKKAAALAPHYTTLPIISCKAGLRATTANHRPLATQLSDNVFLLTGLGSRGLLYHAFMAKQLANSILEKFL